MKPLAAAMCVVAVISGCEMGGTADDEQQRQSDQARIAELESELAARPKAEPATERAAPQLTKLHRTDWQDRDIPERLRAGKAAFRRPDKLLAALAVEVIDLMPGEGGQAAVLRLRPDGDRFIGQISVDELPDDSVASYELRATLAADQRGWHVVELAQRQVCRRGGAGDLCT